MILKVDNAPGTSVAPCPHPAIQAFWDRRGPRWCELLVVAGTPYPTSYGVISGGGPYGRVGLEQDEFFEFITMQAFVDGMIEVAGGDALAWLKGKLGAEVAVRVPPVVPTITL